MSNCCQHLFFIFVSNIRNFILKYKQINTSKMFKTKNNAAKQLSDQRKQHQQAKTVLLISSRNCCSTSFQHIYSGKSIRHLKKCGEKVDEEKSEEEEHNINKLATRQTYSITATAPTLFCLSASHLVEMLMYKCKYAHI